MEGRRRAEVSRACGNRVHRHVLGEVGHPAGDAQVEQVGLDELLVPGGGRLRQQVHGDAAEAAKVLHVVGAAGVRQEVALPGVVLVDVALDVEVGVDVGEHLDSLGVQLLDGRVQAGVARLVPAPVPEEALAEGGVLDAGPVLDPDTGHLYAGVDGLLVARHHHLSAALQAEDDAAGGPVGQHLAAGVGPLDQLQRRAGRHANRHRPRRLRVQLVVRHGAEVERAELVRVAGEVVASGGEEAGLRPVGGVVVPSRPAVQTDDVGERVLRVAQDALLAGPHGVVPAAEVEVGVLLASAEH